MTPFQLAVQKILDTAKPLNAASDALGMSERTLKGWLRGESTPTEAVQNLIIAYANPRQGVIEKPSGKIIKNNS
jgi:DNA-binding transcriptional regulator YiaG